MVIVCKKIMKVIAIVHIISLLSKLGVLFIREPQKKKEFDGLSELHFSEK